MPVNNYEKAYCRVVVNETASGWFGKKYEYQYFPVEILGKRQFVSSMGLETIYLVRFASGVTEEVDEHRIFRNR